MKYKKLVAGALLAGLALFFLLDSNCPLEGLSLSQEARALARLKNRASMPAEEDFDRRVTLEALLQPGDDTSRWNNSQAAAIEGYVINVIKAGLESGNCFSLTRRDIHVEVALYPGALPRERIVVEITPRMIEQAQGRGQDWSAAALARELSGHWCRFEGWLMFDSNHAGEAENTAPGRASNWRATAWEIHPVTDLKIIH